MSIIHQIELLTTHLQQKHQTPLHNEFNFDIIKTELQNLNYDEEYIEMFHQDINNTTQPMFIMTKYGKMLDHLITSHKPVQRINRYSVDFLRALRPIMNLH